MRQNQLQDYINGVVQLMRGSAQYNQALLDFLEYHAAAVSKEHVEEQALSAPFLDCVMFPVHPDTCEVVAKTHMIRLNQQQKPKTYYQFELHFNNGAKIVIEKLFGDFKKLHSFVLTTFQNEMKEF